MPVAANMPFPFPEAPRAQGVDDVTLIATSMAADEHLAACVPDRQARITVVVRRAPRRPALPDLPATQRLGDGFSLHRVPPRFRMSRCAAPHVLPCAPIPPEQRRSPLRSRRFALPHRA